MQSTNDGGTRPTFTPKVRTRHASAVNGSESNGIRPQVTQLLAPSAAMQKNTADKSGRSNSAGTTSRTRSKTLVASNSDNNLLAVEAAQSPIGPLPASPLPPGNQNGFRNSPSPTESVKSTQSGKDGSSPAKHFKINLNQIHPRHMKHVRLDGYGEVERLYKIHQDPIGKGSYGVVYKAADRGRRDWQWAIKKIAKDKAGTGGVGLLEREVNILKRVTHPSIIHLEAVYETPKDMYLVTELCVEGELKAYLKKRKTIPENETRLIIRQLSSALTYLHSYGVVHRDIKLENILVKKSAAQGLSRVGSEASLDESIDDSDSAAELTSNSSAFDMNVCKPRTSLLPKVQPHSKESPVINSDKPPAPPSSRGGKEVSRRSSLQPTLLRNQLGAAIKRDRHFSQPSMASTSKQKVCGQGSVENSSAIDIEIKLTDFGLAVVRGGVSSESMLMTFCGTPVYMAPEVISNHDYSQTCDIWSMGVIAYTLVSGKYPWVIQTGSEATVELYSQIKRGKRTSEYDKCFSSNAVHCISGMLEVNTARRLTAAEVLNHPWTQGIEREAPKNLWDAMKEDAARIRETQGQKTNLNSPASRHSSSRPSSTSSTKR